MRYLIVSDLHGYKERFVTLYSFLSRRGWNMDNDSYELSPPNEDETLVSLGDMVDYGDVPNIHLFAEQMHNPFVISLMGNHDEKLLRYVTTGNATLRNGFQETLDLIKSGSDATKKHRIFPRLENFLTTRPYFIREKHFIGVHAYPSQKDSRLCIYGKVINTPNNEDSPPQRVPWWETEENKWGLPVFYGHYHAKLDQFDYEKKFFCLDNWDAGKMSVAIVESTGEFEILNIDVIKD